MQTQILQGGNLLALQQAATLLRSGEIVAFPTDTVYGLGADAQNETAVNKIYTAKGRPPEKSLIILIHDKEQLHTLTDTVSDTAQKLMDAFWPGPLTLIFPVRANTISDAVTRGRDTIGVRMPNHPVALQLLALAELPIAAPSANISGNPSPITADAVLQDLDGRISAIVAGGACDIGTASTIVDVTCDPPLLLRQGVITKAQIEQVLQHPIKAVIE